ncbi:MAG: hypothetical protein WC782_01960 [Methylococcaceae bacterium]
MICKIDICLQKEFTHVLAANMVYKQIRDNELVNLPNIYKETIGHRSACAKADNPEVIY